MRDPSRPFALRRCRHSRPLVLYSRQGQGRGFETLSTLLVTQRVDDASNLYEDALRFRICFVDFYRAADDVGPTEIPVINSKFARWFR